MYSPLMNMQMIYLFYFSFITSWINEILQSQTGYLHKGIDK